MSTVLVTGAAGRIGTALRDRLPALGWSVRGVDRRAADGVLVADTRHPGELDRVVAGADAVVHLAGLPHEAPWPEIRAANLDGTVEVFEAARRHGVRRVVFASSIHAAGFTPQTDGLPADAPARPDTLYGVSKVFGEALARYYVDRYAMQIACLRLGTFADRPPDAGALATWLSPGDCARLVDACLRSESLRYALVWGVSANTRGCCSLAAGERLGYRPVDDSERYADDLPAAAPPGADSQARHPEAAQLLGGGFTTAGFGIDEVAARW